MISTRFFLLFGLIALASAAVPDYGYLTSLLRQGTTNTAPETSAAPLAAKAEEEGHSHADNETHSAMKKKNGTAHHEETEFIDNEAFRTAKNISCNSTAAETGCADTCECHESMGFCFAKARSDDIHSCHCKENDSCEFTNVTGDTCSSELCPGCVSKVDLKSIATCVTAAENPPCVSTAWLKSAGVAHATLRHAGMASVLCIPGSTLPCGTPGHLLRQGASLVSYREVCATRTCVESAMHVSQLSHTFDWSVYKSVNGLELTSLSAHPDSYNMSPSRIIAKFADALNRAGLGSVTNAVAGVMNADKFVPSFLCATSSMA